MEAQESKQLEDVLDARVLWYLVLGDVSSKRVANKCDVSLGTITSWVSRERKYWGGVDAAKIVAKGALRWEPIPKPRQLRGNKKIKAIVVRKALKTLNESLPDFREQPVPENLEAIYLKSAQDAAAVISKLCSSENRSPQDLEALANAADGWARLQYRIEEQRARREKRVLDLQEREEQVSLREEAACRQAASVAMLAKTLEGKQAQIMAVAEQMGLEGEQGPVTKKKKRRYKTKEFRIRHELDANIAA